MTEERGSLRQYGRRNGRKYLHCPDSHGDLWVFFKDSSSFEVPFIFLTADAFIQLYQQAHGWFPIREADEKRKFEWGKRERDVWPLHTAWVAGQGVCSWLAIGQRLPDGHLGTKRRPHRKSESQCRKWVDRDITDKQMEVHVKQQRPPFRLFLLMYAKVPHTHSTETVSWLHCELWPDWK